MKKIITILTSVIGFNVYCQYQIFIEPCYITKFNFSRVDRSSINNDLIYFIPPQPVYTPGLVSHSSRFVRLPSFDYGVKIGVKLLESENIFSISYNRDKVSYKTQSSFRFYDELVHNGLGLYLEPQIHRFSLNAAKKINSKLNFLDMRISGSLGLMLFRNPYEKIDAVERYNFYLTPDTRLDSIFLQPNPTFKTAPFAKIGFEVDVKTKKSYLFSLNAYFIQGFSEINSVYFRQHYTTNGAQEINSIRLMSRGSGFYFEISRRIGLYATKPKDKTSL